MKVIAPSFTVLDHYFKNGAVIEQIELCGRVCYKSEDEISPGSAQSFIRRIIERGHESVLEMVQIVLDVEVGSDSTIYKFLETNPRFCQISKLEKKRYFISGNPRTFRDVARDHHNLKVTKAVLRQLTGLYPVLFEDLAPQRGWIPQDGIKIRVLTPDEVDGLSIEQLIRHRTLLVKMIVNRAVTHELVRHRIASYLQESQRYCRYGESRFGGEVVFVKPCFFEDPSEEYRLWTEAMARAEESYLRLLKTSSPQAARTVLPNSCKTEIMVHANLAEWMHIFSLRASKAADPSMREIMLKILPEFSNRFPAVFDPIADGLRLQQ